MAAVAVAKSTLAEQQKHWKEQQLDKIIEAVGKRVIVARSQFYLKRKDGLIYTLFGTTGIKNTPDDAIRLAAESLGCVMPLQPEDQLSDPKAVKREAEEITRAIRAIEWDLTEFDATKGEVVHVFPAIEARIDLCNLPTLREKLEGLSHWMRSKGVRD